MSPFGRDLWFLVNSIISQTVRRFLILATKKCRIYAAFGVSQTPRKENYMKRIVAYAMPVILAFRKRLVNVKGKGGGNMMKKHLKKVVSFALVLSMTFPVGMSYRETSVEAKVIDSDYNKDVLWSTSFESADGFKTSTVDDKKGTANIATNELRYQINGNLSGEIESYSGSAAKNDNEVLKNLFDGDSGTKYLTEVKPSEGIVKH